MKPAYYDPELGISILAIDWFNANGKTPGETYVDVAFVAMFDTHEQATEYFKAYAKKYAIVCEHDNVSVEYTVDDDDNTSIALVNAECLICGYTCVKEAPHAINVEAISGHFSGKYTGLKTTPYMFNSTDSLYPAAGFVTPNGDKTLAVAGWGGAYGTVTTTAYRVLDAEGNVVISWTNSNSVNSASTDISTIRNNVNSVLPAADSAFRFETRADLASLYTEANYGKMFKIEYAYIVDDEVVGNDKYIVCAIVENVKIPTPYTVNIGTYSVDGTAETTLGKGAVDAPITVDLTGVAVTKSLIAKGWCVTPNGIEKYTYRVTDAEGKATYYDIAAEGHYNGDDEGIANAGISSGYGENSKLNSNFQMYLPGLSVDLTAHDGDTVTVELIAVNNNGDELVILAFNNVTVGTPAAE